MGPMDCSMVIYVEGCFFTFIASPFHHPFTKRLAGPRKVCGFQLYLAELRNIRELLKI